MSLGSRGIDVDDGRSRLGKTSRKQTALSPPMPAVPVTQFGILFAQVKRVSHFRAGEHPECGLTESADSFQRLRQVEIVAEAVETGDKSLAVIKTAIVDSRRQRKVFWVRNRVSPGRRFQTLCAQYPNRPAGS